MISCLIFEIVLDPVTIVHFNNVQTKHLRVELGDQNHVQQENHRTNHEIVVVVVNIHPKIRIDQTKIRVGVHARKHA